MWINRQSFGVPVGGAEIAAASIDHLHRYIELLFEPAKRRGKEIS
jgi:hypothetical protein